MRVLREISRIMVGLVVGAGAYEILFVQTGMDRLWVLLVAGGLVLFGLWALREGAGE
jgi:hypothetical protein